MSKRLRVLILSAEPPFPPEFGGARIRLYHAMRGLAQSHDLTLLTLLENAQDETFLDPLRPFCRRLVAFPAPALDVPPTLRQRLDAPFYRLAHTPEMAAAIRRELAEQPYDLVHADTTRMAVYTPLLTGHRKVMAATDAISLAYRSRLGHIGHPLMKLRSRYTLATVEKFIGRQFAQYDAAAVVSERDAEEIRRLCPELPVSVIPNGVDCEWFCPRDVVPDADRLVFTGTMDYGPNIDAAGWLVKSVLPRVLAERPAVRLEIAGRNPTADVLSLAQPPQVTVTGFVPDLRPVLAGAAVFLCPLREGAGMKNKVLEAMAMGKAIVSTTEGVNGIGGTAGVEYLVADTPEDFARTVVSLLQDPVRSQALGRAARAHVERRFSWKYSAELFDELYRQVAITSPPRGKAATAQSSAAAS